MSDQTPGRPSRRKLVKGVAWAVPTLAVATAAPAFAGSPPRGGITVAGPWYNTWPSARGVNGDHGGIIPYIIMGTDNTAGSAFFDQNSSQSSTFHVNGNGAYECSPDSASYGSGDQITITITENLGTYYTETPVKVSEREPGPAAWPDLILRDRGMYTVTNYSSQLDGAAYWGVKTPGQGQWTWTLQMNRNHRGCNTDPVTFDLRFRSQGLGEHGGQRLSQYTITTVSPWGTVTQEVPAE